MSKEVTNSRQLIEQLNFTQPWRQFLTITIALLSVITQGILVAGVHTEITGNEVRVIYAIMALLGCIPIAVINAMDVIGLAYKLYSKNNPVNEKTMKALKDLASSSIFICILGVAIAAITAIAIANAGSNLPEVIMAVAIMDLIYLVIIGNIHADAVKITEQS